MFRFKKFFALTTLTVFSSAACAFASAATCPSNSAAPQALNPSQEIVVDTEDNRTEKASVQRSQIHLKQGDVVRLSEALGHLIGRNLENPSLELDLESIIKGMRDAAAGREAPMSEEEYEMMMSSIQESAFNDLAKSNLEEANDFLQKNAQEEGVVEVVPGKLQYTVLSTGKGEAVSDLSMPTLTYTGTFVDGTVFGTSTDSGGPITLSLDQAIPGFSQGILGMKQGEKRRLYIHPDLGYGTSSHLPPNSLLVFDIEILSIDNQPLQDNNTLPVADTTDEQSHKVQ